MSRSVGIILFEQPSERYEFTEVYAPPVPDFALESIKVSCFQNILMNMDEDLYFKGVYSFF